MTATTSTTPARKRPPKIMYKVVNPIMKTILRSPFHERISKRLLLLSYTGRKSGKRYTIPVGYTQVGDEILITTQAGWGKSLRGGLPVRVRLRGKDHAGVADVDNSETALRDGYRIMLRSEPQLGEIIGVALDANGEPKPEDVARARENGYMIVRIKLS